MTTIPTIAQLYSATIAALDAEFGTSISPFGKAVLRALAGVWAGILKMYYLAIANLQKNIWVDTAESVAVGGTLERFGFTKLGRLPYPATQGYYTCTVNGTTGAVIPALTQFRSDDDSSAPGFLFILDTAYTLPASSGSITLRSLTAGITSQLAITDTLTPTAPIIDVTPSATVSAISVFPVAAETIEEYRAKALQAYQIRPQGGAPADYRLWGLDAAGVRQIYPYAWSGHSNEVLVYVEATVADSVGPPFKGVPTPTIIAAVEAAIQADPTTTMGRRPLAVENVEVVAINPLTITIEVDSNGTITVDQQAVIKQALIEGTYLIRPFIAGIDNLVDRNDTISAYGLGNMIFEAIGGVIISAITLTVSGAPVASYEFDNGEIPYLAAAAITFI